MHQLHRRVLFLAVAELAACGPVVPSSLFESDAEGWTLSNNTDQLQPELLAQGGNPAGHICGQDAQDGDIWYFVAPQKYLGDMSRMYGKRATFDVKQSSNYFQIKGRDVVLNGGGLAISADSRFTPGLDWTPYSFRLDDKSGWVIDDPRGQGTAATEQDVRTVLSDLTALRIRGEFVDGPLDRSCLDNVFFGRD